MHIHIVTEFWNTWNKNQGIPKNSLSLMPPPPPSQTLGDCSSWSPSILSILSHLLYPSRLTLSPVSYRDSLSCLRVTKNALSPLGSWGDYPVCCGSFEPFTWHKTSHSPHRLIVTEWEKATRRKLPAAQIPLVSTRGLKGGGRCGWSAAIPSSPALPASPLTDPTCLFSHRPHPDL